MEDNHAPEMKVSFKDTLNLPQTDFPIRPNAAVDDPAMIERWVREDLYAKSFDLNKGKDSYILMDGPPYANGHLHVGHAYNKILKDIVTKSRRMSGMRVPVVPGWDCHGLPIEFKVSQENPGLSRSELKKACRAYANHWIDVQRNEFKRLGVLMNWEHPYRTMDPHYEADTIRAFGKFVQAGYIDRKNKTVAWCASCQTVLASAEIEYQDRKDPSIYALFPLDEKTQRALFPDLNKRVSAVVWTTTPWTLPLNRAVLLKPQASYVVLDIKNEYVLVGEELADALAQVCGDEKRIIARITSDAIVAAAARAQHPLIERYTVPFIADNSVSTQEGTAFVHNAPGAGPIDYEVGVKNHLEIFSPVSPDGKYTSEIQPTELQGMSVADGQIWVIKKLIERGLMLQKGSITHSYPHCWRCRNGLIFRATKQWFCDLERNGLKEKAMQAIDTIDMLPDKSNNRFKATLEGRLEWCLSRQRVWGTPIPAFICTACDYTYITPELIDRVADEVSRQGIEYWDMVKPSDFLPAGFTCPGCKGSSFAKEEDILDVWFDSGVSHFAVLCNNEDLAYPADLYLEGKDQHRGWFQSSLLTSVALSGQPSMSTIITHGFTVDDKGRKMSKSLGNVVSPQEMIDRLGTDGLRLWVSSIDCSGEAVVSDVLIKNVQEVFRKIRNTCRFLLSNLYDFDYEKDLLVFDRMLMIDQRALVELKEVHKLILNAYERYDFTTVFHALGDYTASALSAFYLDIIKDRLYVAAPAGIERRSAQTACYLILDTLTRLMAPIMSFTAEQLSDLYQKNKKASIHLQAFSALDAMTLNTQAHAQDTWETLKSMRSAVLKAIEEKRALGLIKHPLEASVTMFVDPQAPFVNSLHAFFAALDHKKEYVESFFKEFFIVSAFDMVTNRAELPESIMPGLYVQVDRAQGMKCPRCWQWTTTQHEHGLCSRCEPIVAQLRSSQ